MLEPRRRYTQAQIRGMWSSFETRISTTSLFRAKIGKSTGYGQLLVRHTDGTVSLHPDLIEAFERYF